MTDPIHTIEVSLTALLAKQGNALTHLENLAVYADSVRHNAALLRDLAGNEEGSVEIDRQSLHRAMSAQVYWAEGIQLFTQSLQAIAEGATQPEKTEH